MSFDLIGPHSIVQIGDEQAAVFALPQAYGEPSAFFPQIASNFYSSSAIGAGSVLQFRDEAERLLVRRRAELSPAVKRDRKVFSRDQRIENEILTRLLRQDPVYSLLEDIIALCDECFREGVGIRCEGD